MKKIDLLDGNVPNQAISVTQDSNTVYAFTTNIDNFDNMIEWLYTNTTGRFTFLGTTSVYFENDDDAALFKLSWFGEGL